MHPLILISFDLLVSAALVLLGMYMVWSRVRSQLECNDEPTFDPAGQTAERHDEVPSEVSVPHGDDRWAFKDTTMQAATLKEKGLSIGEIAQRLQIPTREVEMVLAISDMAETKKSGKGRPAGFPLHAEAVHTV